MLFFTITSYHNQILSSKRQNRAQMKWSVLGCQKGALLQRSESQQWMRTPGSSCCWQCLEVAQPLVKTIPRAAGGTEKRDSQSERSDKLVCGSARKKSITKHQTVKCVMRNRSQRQMPQDIATQEGTSSSIYINLKSL